MGPLDGPGWQGSQETQRPSAPLAAAVAPSAPSLCLSSLLWTLQAPDRVLPEVYPL